MCVYIYRERKRKRKEKEYLGRGLITSFMHLIHHAALSAERLSLILLHYFVRVMRGQRETMGEPGERAERV